MRKEPHMSRTAKRIMQGIVAIVLTVLVMGVSSTTAQAAAKYSLGYSAVHAGSLTQVTNGKTYTVYLHPSTGKVNNRLTGTLYYWKWTNNFTNVKVGNSNIIVAGNKWSAWTGENTTKGMQLWLMPRKVGKTTLSYTFKGKTHKVNIVVKSWVKNPIKRLVVSGATLAPKKYGSEYVYSQGNKNLNGKSIKVVPATGWKIKSIYAVDDMGYDSVAIKNVSRMKVYYNVVHITMQNTSTGAFEDVILTGAA